MTYRSKLKQEALKRLSAIRHEKERAAAREAYLRGIQDGFAWQGLAFPMDFIIGADMAAGLDRQVTWPMPEPALTANGRKFIKVYSGPGYPIDPAKQLNRDCKFPVLRW